MEPIRGQALLTVAKLVRKRNPEVLKCLDESLYGKVKGLYSKNYQGSMKIILEHRSFQNIAKFLEDQKNCRTRRGPRLVRVFDGDQRSG